MQHLAVTGRSGAPLLSAAKPPALLQWLDDAMWEVALFQPVSVARKCRLAS
jgi:hypothetical protein